jgi:hypothetical protein
LDSGGHIPVVFYFLLKPLRFDSAKSISYAGCCVAKIHQTKNERRNLIMARAPMVTRTITTTECVVLCLEVAKAEPFNKAVTLPRTYTDDKKLLEKVREIVDTNEVKAVHIVSKKEVETLYGMTEQKFIENAKVLPPRGVKETEEEEENVASVSVN